MAKQLIPASSMSWTSGRDRGRSNGKMRSGGKNVPCSDKLFYVVVILWLYLMSLQLGQEDGRVSRSLFEYTTLPTSSSAAIYTLFPSASVSFSSRNDTGGISRTATIVRYLASISPSSSSSSSSGSSTHPTDRSTGNLRRDDDDLMVQLLRQNYFYQAWLGLDGMADTLALPVPLSIEGNKLYSYDHNRDFNTTNTSNTTTITDWDKASSPVSQFIPALDVLTTYITQHSQFQLQAEYDEYLMNMEKANAPTSSSLPSDQGTQTSLFTRRRYMVAVWSCPLESGNRLHRFMNGLLWAVLTNRTLLWRYHTPQVCQEYFEYDENNDKDAPGGGGIAGGGQNNCQELYGNNVDPYTDCSTILRLASWVPSYDEWKSRIITADTKARKQRERRQYKNESSLSESSPVETIVRYSMQQDGNGNWKQYDKHRCEPWDRQQDDYDEDDNDDNGGRVGDENEVGLSAGGGYPLFIRPGNQVVPNPGGILIRPSGRDRPYLSQPSNILRLKRLLTTTANGTAWATAVRPKDDVYFIYGMMFESLFTIHPSINLGVNLHANVDDESNDKPLKESTSSSQYTPLLWDFAVSHNNTKLTTTTRMKTVFIHSRHPSMNMAEYVLPEHRCLRKMFPVDVNVNNDSDKDRSNVSCHIWVMSDSNVTFPLLHHEISNLTRCKHTSQYTMSMRNAGGSNMNAGRTLGKSFRAEHGPFAGRGYWEDLSVAIQARDGMIAFHKSRRAFGLARTSTSLVRNIIEFRRRLEHIVRNLKREDWNTKAVGNVRISIPPLLPFEECLNPSRS